MKKWILLFGLFILVVSCASHQSVNRSEKAYGSSLKSKSFRNENSHKVNKIISDAESYLGVPYKFGGMTYSGFDCSGFVSKVFSENNIQLTRRTVDQAKEGSPVHISEVKSGDLLLFATSSGRNISHIGIVHTIENDGEIKFIHASTSKGVIISSLNEKYWNNAFLFARRIL